MFRSFGYFFIILFLLGGCHFLNNKSDVCPTGFVFIAENKELEVPAFCVMKFEAKEGELGLPTSRPEGKPWVNLGLGPALSKCRSLGKEYNLISNPQWMAVAREIEAQRRNWTSNRIGEGQIYRGHSDGSPFNILSVKDVSDYYDQTQNSRENGREQRRVHYLSGDQKIWDFAGNTWSWVNWEESDHVVLGPRNCVNGAFEFYELNQEICNPEDLKEIQNNNLWASRSEWTSVQGIGKFLGSYGSTGGAARRGGHRSDGSIAGIYALSLSYPPESRLSYIGFRCVYRPNR